MSDLSVDELSPVLVIGAGLLGASVGCALTAVGLEVHLRDANPTHAQVAAQIGAGVVENINPAAVATVIVAVPPRALAPVIAAALDEFPHAVVTDVGSVKGTVLQALRERCVLLDRYVGSHPMAGSHRAGPLTASADLFVDRTWVVTPHATATPGTVLAARRLGELCRGVVVEMDPFDHDVAVAAVSHVPHTMSVLTAASLTASTPAHLQLAGAGVRDVTRIAASDTGLWDQILGENSPAIVARLSWIHQQLGTLIDALSAGRSVRTLLETGQAGTRAIPGKHGLPAVAHDHVIVQIADAPGSLARIFAEADAAGVNIEDIAIDHDPVQQVGWLSLAVVPERTDALAATMRDRGWNVQVEHAGE